jgi:CRISPR-associated protein Cas1
MLKRTLFFITPCHLSIRNHQLVVKNKETQTEKSVPVEDIGYVILDNLQITLTQSVPEYLAENNTALIFCNEKHHPTAMNFILDSHQLQGELFDLQIKASEPLKKQLWQQTIVAKIRNQGLLLKKLGKNDAAMVRFAGTVKSGDTTNREAIAAKYYWGSLFDTEPFRREREGENPNSLFNYTYAVLRAATAKALVGSGLLPTFGIHHRNRYNAYRLADDIMEPYRPIVDELILNVWRKYPNYEELTSEIKAELLQTLTCDVQFKKKKRPLAVALSHTTASLAQCFAGEKRIIKYPMLIINYK